MVRWYPSSKQASLQLASPTNRACDRAWVEISTHAIAYNVRQLCRYLQPHTELMAIVKADAYGHGDICVSQVALEAGASWLGVATIAEGIQLREAGIDAPILILGATYSSEQAQDCWRWQLQPTICTPQQALIFSEACRSQPTNQQQQLPVHINIDTGMTRVGIHWQQASEFLPWISKLPYLQVEAIYSHFATADSPDRQIMEKQHQRFRQAIASIGAAGVTIPKLHLANSAATLCDRSTHYDLVRVGLALYGLYPAPHLQEFGVDLQPAMSVKARITQVKTIPPATGISYGHLFVSQTQMRVAVVSIGYADGVLRNLSNRMQAIVRGRLVQQIGAITMDQLTIDVSDVPNVQAGDIVTLLGSEGDGRISAEDWAQTLDTISWEILCGFKYRLPRITV